MRPYADDLDRPDSLQDLIDQPVLDIDAPRIRSLQIADQFFKRWRSLKAVCAHYLEKGFGFGPESRGGEFLGVLLGLPGIDELPRHQCNTRAHFFGEVLSPFRMEPRMPGMDNR